MYKCPNCDFECASTKLLEQHMEREALGLTEYEQKKMLQQMNSNKRLGYLEMNHPPERIKYNGNKND